MSILVSQFQCQFQCPNDASREGAMEMTLFIYFMNIRVTLYATLMRDNVANTEIDTLLLGCYGNVPLFNTAYNTEFMQHA